MLCCAAFAAGRRLKNGLPECTTGVGPAKVGPTRSARHPDRVAPYGAGIHRGSQRSSDSFTMRVCALRPPTGSSST